MSTDADILKPQSPQQRLVELRGAASILQGCNARRVLLEGRAGTGKTGGILHKVHSWCSTYPKLRVALIRESCVSLRSTILKTLEELVVPENHPILRGASREHRSSYNYPGTKAHIGLFGLDDPQNLFSSEWDLIYVGEGTQCRKDDIETLSRSLRNYKGPYHQLIIDCNPDAPGHWLNQLATKAGNDLRESDTREKYERLQAWNDRPADPESRELHRLISVHQDNPAYFDVDSWEWTGDGKLYLQALGDMTSHRRQRMLNGRWVAAEGSVYPEFNEDMHVCQPFGWPADWPVIVGYDPGYAHPTAVVWLGVAPTEDYFIIDEIYQGGRSVDEHAREIIKRSRGLSIRGYYGDPQHMFSQTAQSPRTIANQLHDHGLSFSWPRTAGQEEAMVEAVRQLLAHRDERGVPKPKLEVFSNCKNTIAEFESWSYRRTPKGDLPPGPDKFEDANNHAMDVVKGLVARRPVYSSPEIRVFRHGPGQGWYFGDDDDEDD